MGVDDALDAYQRVVTNTLADVIDLICSDFFLAAASIEAMTESVVVPNGTLVSGNLINWTLSDSKRRVEVSVGVAYGTDTRRATSLIREICAAHPDVLKDPETLITFQEFGNSTLTIVIRLYLASLDKRLPVLDDIHTAIHERFAAEGIEIAFPQLDVHVTAATAVATPAPARSQTSPHPSAPT